MLRHPLASPFGRGGTAGGGDGEGFLLVILMIAIKVLFDSFQEKECTPDFYPFTPPEVRPATKCFSMHRNRMTTGMVAKMEVANRYCHLMKLKP